MTPEQKKVFVEELRDCLQYQGDDFDVAVEQALYSARTAGLDALKDAELEMRKHDLAQIGFVLLSMVGEANHNAWDGSEREDLVQFNHFLKEFIINLGFHGHYQENAPWGFGGDEWWDKEGKRHTRSGQ